MTKYVYYHSSTRTYPIAPISLSLSFRKVFPRPAQPARVDTRTDTYLTSRNTADAYYNLAHQHNNRLLYGQRTRSETILDSVTPSCLHLSPRYEKRLFNGSGAPISTNPLWASTSPVLSGSQPNLLSPRSHADHIPAPSRFRSPTGKGAADSNILKHPSYAGQSTEQLDHRQRPAPPSLPPALPNHKRDLHSAQYFPTNEFILRPIDGHLQRHSNHNEKTSHPPPVDHRIKSLHVSPSNTTMLDVYY
jgi:hypothetical protein